MSKYKKREDILIITMQDVNNALAQSRLEGLTVPQETVEDMKRIVKGEVTIEQCIAKALKKYSHDKVRRKRPLRMY